MKTLAAFLLRAAPCVAAGLLFTGCVGVVPKPVSSTKVEYGRKLAPADVAFIQPGVTTRAEVVAKLGTDFTALPKERAIAYSWEMKGGGGVWWYFLVAGYAGAAANGGSWEGGWRACFIAFDEQGVVTATAFKQPSTRTSLHEHLYAWVGFQPAKPTVVYHDPIIATPPSMLAGSPKQ